MSRKKFSPNTISSRVAMVKSFFKYNDLPLAYVPIAKPRVLYHNRDITHEEINLILGASRPRERAFFALMAQSGLRPNTICLLRFKDIKEDFTQKRIPCKIDVPQEIAKGKYHAYFTFIGEEAVNHLHSYLAIRPQIRDDDYIFVKQGTEGKM
ncbi:MAG: tyrosine-type recombinase/integrase, partial [Candidatus Bathyarchaeota archaeon]|nr:tyrosine-type recombinase/integrase [Candidatus Bathyarchaeota archaeon]